MGCFLACFGSVGGRNRKKKTLPREQIRRNYEPLQSSSPSKQTETEQASVLLPLLSDKPQDLSFQRRKKVAFDLNVKIYDDVSTDEVTSCSLEIDKKKEGAKEADKAEKENQVHLLSEQYLTALSGGSYPSNHRYKDCVNNEEDEEEEEDIELEDSDLDDEDDTDTDVVREEMDECIDSYLPIPVEKERQFSASPFFKEEIDVSRLTPDSSSEEKSTVTIKGNARDRSKYVHSVLNPVENLSQWRAVKAKTAPPKRQKKNINLEQELHLPLNLEPNFKLPNPQIPLDSSPSLDLSKTSNQEISVNASLSTWLTPSKTTAPIKTCFTPIGSSNKSKSQRSCTLENQEKQPILRSMTVDEFKQPSPRLFPNQRPDEIPLLGTEVTSLKKKVDI